MWIMLMIDEVVKFRSLQNRLWELSSRKSWHADFMRGNMQLRQHATDQRKATTLLQIEIVIQPHTHSK